MYRILTAILSTCALGCTAQDYSWWNDIHNWDGTTHWSRYITFSPYYMGPNALPVPSVTQGYFLSETRLSLGGQGHFSDGDDTQDIITGLHVPFAGGRVAVELDWMAVERYVTDTIVRDMRAARGRDGTGTSTGDVYIATLVQLVPEREHGPGLMLRIRLKTASGNALGDARHTDAPGYSFDLSVGQWKQAGGKWMERWRPFAMAGFYVYQTNRTDYFQNDCLLFGAGAIVDHGAFKSTVAVAGYMGYLDERDTPVVLRASLGTDRPGRTEHELRLQAPLNDWRYVSVGYTFSLNLGGVLGGSDGIRGN